MKRLNQHQICINVKFSVLLKNHMEINLCNMFLSDIACLLVSMAGWIKLSMPCFIFTAWDTAFLRVGEKKITWLCGRFHLMLLHWCACICVTHDNRNRLCCHTHTSKEWDLRDLEKRSFLFSTFCRQVRAIFPAGFWWLNVSVGCCFWNVAIFLYLPV